MKAYRLLGLPLILVGLLYLLGPEPGLFGFGTRGGVGYWLTGGSLLSLGLGLCSLPWWWRGP